LCKFTLNALLSECLLAECELTGKSRSGSSGWRPWQKWGVGRRVVLCSFIAKNYLWPETGTGGLLKMKDVGVENLVGVQLPQPLLSTRTLFVWQFLFVFFWCIFCCLFLSCQ